MEVLKRDGRTEKVRFEKIAEAVSRACRGLERVDPVEVAKRTISGLHAESTTRELDELSISNAVMLMAEEPNYSKVAARILAESIRKEVGRDTTFEDYLSQAVGLGLLSPKVSELAFQDISMIDKAIDHSRDDLFEYFGLKTIADRYLLRHPKLRSPIERPQWLFMRVALGLSQTVTEAVQLYTMMSKFEYMPSTPTLFNSGTLHPQMSSCYLLTMADDSIEGIYKTITDCAKLGKWSGGLGVSWTSVRSSGALIKGTNGLSNGIIPFLKVFDSSVHAVNQGGKRKGAAAVYLEPWHADIEAFLDLKNNTGSEERRTHNLNLAVWISDLFMKRVETGSDWSLFSPSDAPKLYHLFGKEFEAEYERLEKAGVAMKSIPARNLYAKMMQTLAETGNGWLCFKDTSNLRSPQTGAEGRTIHSSNLCTEILEVTSGSETAVCNLGSLNLPTFIKKMDGKEATINDYDFEMLHARAKVALRFLDRVVDINYYPTDEAKNSNNGWRPVGLGLMGLQDLLFRLRLPFDGVKTREFSNRIMETIYHAAVEASCELAEQHGPFEEFKNSRYPTGGLQPMLSERLGMELPQLHFDWEALDARVRKHGVRNSLMIAIAPTATIASIVGSYESIEPQISNIFKRETLSGEFLQVNRYLISDLQKIGMWTQTIRNRIISENGSIQGIKEIPEALRNLYKTVWEISQKDLIDLAADRSTFICQSQSLNLFMENPTVGKISSMYMYAWKRGVKTTYYLRSRAKTAISRTTVSEESYPENTTEQAAADVVCSLENPDSCESCQ